MQRLAFAPSPLSRPERRRRARISITPLVDVVFILLIFFMLASSFLDWRTIELGAASSSAGAAPADGEGALLLELGRDGVRLGGALLDDDALRARLEARLQELPETRVLLRPAKGIDMQRTIAVLDLLDAAGVRRLDLMPAP